MTPKFSVVLPCYNEADTLPELFTRFAAVLAGRDDVEVIFVNNGSKDASTTVFQHELAKPGRSWARLVEVAVNQGYGFGILQGLRAARGDYFGWTHADSQYHPSIVTDGFALLSKAANPENTLVQGRRIGRNCFDGFFTGVMTLVASSALGVWVSDINAQPKLFPRTLFAAMENPPDDFSLDLYALFVARKRGLAILRLPVVFGRRVHGEAKGGGSIKLKWKLTKRTWAFIRQLRQDIRQGKI